MLTKFYSYDGGNGNAAVDNGHTGNEERESRFPEDPGMEDGRIPDGGGPADGFINEEGKDSGKGFLNHVDDSENNTKKQLDEGGGSEGHG